MTPSEATEIAEWIVDTWPLTSKPRVWTDALGPMDYAESRATYRALRNDRTERSLTVAEFRAAYRARRTPVETPPLPVCHACAGDGWVDRDYVGGGRPYRGVEPCPVCGTERATSRTYAVVRAGVRSTA